METPSEFQGQGKATRLMSEVCSQADAEQIDLELYVVPLTGPGLNLHQLLRFYSKHGFRWIDDADDGSPIMERKAKVPDGNIAKNLIATLTRNNYRLIHIIFNYSKSEWEIEIDRNGGQDHKVFGDRNWGRAVAKTILAVNE